MTRLMSAGVEAQAASKTLSLLVPVGTSFFPTVSLLRAIRWGVSVVLQTYGSDLPVPIRAITSREVLGPSSPQENLLRMTTSAMAAVIGGANSLSILPNDVQTGATARGNRLARGISHLLREESYLGLVSDPAAGSHYVETLTGLIGEKAWSLFQRWETDGGLAAALTTGGPQEMLAASLARRESALQSGEQVRVGINRFCDSVEEGA
jgi:methylmalonyl-CoA mutase